MRLAFGFRAGSGKDHATEYLRGKFGGHNLKFAQPIKDLAELVQIQMGFPIEKDRDLLQWLGTDMGRRRDPEIWVRRMQKLISETPPAHLFVSDLRFKNEASALKKLGFLLVRLERLPPQTHPAWAAHSSETELEDYDGWDFLIKNCGTKEHFEGQLDVLWDLAKQADDLINRQCTEIK